ncbi:uncharacterized protein [Coffea arabica]|uniref:Reverse transcriptase domain-containing protein n=1 Tax=Coffea arabica TaxID=13443 RepID=A0A6P6VHU3_COFAR|nr:uncharacterized protein LOC113722407 [Coffea arabica]
MNRKLTRPVSDQEISQAVNSMHPNKSPRPDEGLSAILRRANRQGSMYGIKIANEAPSLSHLLFTDDLLIFCRAKVGEAVQLMKVLEDYGRASEQLINKDKSSIFFSKNVKGRKNEEVLKELEGMREVHQSKYLRFPMIIRRSKRQVFEFIRQKTVKKTWRLEGKTPEPSRQGDSIEVCHPSSSSTCYVLLQGTKDIV